MIWWMLDALKRIRTQHDEAKQVFEDSKLERRPLTYEEQVLITVVREHGEHLAKLVDLLEDAECVDRKWVDVGRTHLAQGMMALARAIGKEGAL